MRTKQENIALLEGRYARLIQHRNYLHEQLANIDDMLADTSARLTELREENPDDE